MTLWICRPPTGKILYNRGNESTEKCELGDDGKVASLQNRRIWRMSTFIQWRVGMKKEKVLSFGGSQQTGWLSGKNFWLFVDNFLTTDGPATSLSLSAVLAVFLTGLFLLRHFLTLPSKKKEKPINDFVRLTWMDTIQVYRQQMK